MDFTGKITEVLPLQQGTSKQGNPWMKQEYIITDATQRTPKNLLFEVFGQDKLQAFNLRVGDEITVNLDPDVRKYTDKNGVQRASCSLSAWGILRGGVPVRVTPNQAAYANQAPQQPYGAQPYNQPTQPAAMPQQPAYGAQPAYQQPAQPAQPAAAPGWTPAPATTAGQSAGAPDFQGQFHQ